MNDWLEYVDGDRYEINILELLKLLFHHIAAIIIVTLLFGGGVYAYSAFCITPLYESQIKMYVNNTVDSSDSSSISSADISASQSLVDTYAVVLTSRPTLDEVIEQTGADYTYEQLKSMITTSAINDTEVFSVVVTSTDPREAADIANAIAEIAPGEIAEVVSGSSVKIVEYATVATSSSSPDITGNALKGALAGLILSCAWVLVASLLRNGMSVEEKIRKDFKDEAVLSAIPLMGKKSRGKTRKGTETAEQAELCEKLNFAAAEAYKLLRENISFSFADVPSCRVIGVTSSARSEGKSTTAVNLAYSLALAKKKVCLVDCDFRLPTIAKTLHMKRRPGITNFLAAPAESPDVIQAYKTEQASFYVIPAGDIPPNPSELLGSKRMQGVLEFLGKSFDYMILDLPPVGIVSDALTVSKAVGGMLFVVSEDQYDRRTLRESLRKLEGVDTKLLGMVVTRSTSQEKEYRRYGEKYGHKYGYEYGYGYGYGPETKDSPKDHDAAKKRKKA